MNAVLSSLKIESDLAENLFKQGRKIKKTIPGALQIYSKLESQTEDMFQTFCSDT